MTFVLPKEGKTNDFVPFSHESVEIDLVNSWKFIVVMEGPELADEGVTEGVTEAAGKESRNEDN